MNLPVGEKVRFRDNEWLKKAEVLIFDTVDFLDMP